MRKEPATKSGLLMKPPDSYIGFRKARPAPAEPGLMT
jgi:hypothetical protein